MAFENRWRIEGTLRTLSSLHIGSGLNTTHPDITVSSDNGDRSAQIAAVVLDHRQLPYIPASTLKGVIRAWLEQHQDETLKTLIAEVFGSQEKGSKVDFHDAVLCRKPQPKCSPPYWREERQTAIDVSVRIDRRTRTAQDKKLFYQEFVPADVEFKITLTGQNLNDDEIALLLAGLNAFNSTDQALSLGGDTRSGYGRMSWKPERISRLTKAGLQNWLAKSDRTMWFEALEKLNDAEVEALQRRVAGLLPVATAKPLAIEAAIEFLTPFLVNDPDPSRVESEKTADHRPRRDKDGHAALPEKSLRGALRAQAEKIYRTLYRDDCIIDEEAQVKKRGEQDKLDLPARLFGAPGWRSPLRITDCRCEQQPFKPQIQEFVAIDRFTGGGADKLKFNAEFVYKPVYKVTLEVDEKRATPAGMGLLMLVLRDLQEGDVSLGYGAAKGYGICRAKLTLPSTEQLPDWMEALRETTTKRNDDD
jgi:CRISPR/Cas system CSM-associated protein Csm3 (group 7 of RAMP superfamily)